MLKLTLGCLLLGSLAARCKPAPVSPPPASASIQSKELVGRGTALSDEQLHARIKAAKGRVFIGFKEAGAQRGVGPHGEILASRETVQRMRTYLTNLGVRLEYASASMPFVGAHVPDDFALIVILRQHENVDYIEPIFPGKFH